MQTHCWTKDHLGTEKENTEYPFGTKEYHKRKKLGTGQWKDRELKHIKLHILECSKDFTTLFLKSTSQQEPVVTLKNCLNLFLNIYIYLTYLLEFIQLKRLT